MAKPLHPESLLNVPLVRQALSDPDLRFQPRAIDAEWFYQKSIPISVTGFNPFLSTYFYGQNSLIAEWFKSPKSSARRLNEGDLLVREVFFMVHDSLHAWAYRCVRALAPQLKLGAVPITRKNFEDYVFVHLLTEAVATVGLDYWYLSTIDLNDICDLGSDFKSLTVSYRQEHEEEYRRFSPSFEAQRPEFFDLITRFYCDGIFPGFSIQDLKRSPRLLKWLNGELTYGETQREYSRSWLSYLSQDQISLASRELRAPIDISQPWRRRLIHDVGQLLWDKVKNSKEHARFPRFESAALWPDLENRELDFRFLNLNRLTPSKSFKSITEGRQIGRNFRHFFYQYVSAFDYKSFNPRMLKLFDDLVEKKDFKRAQDLFKNQKRIKRERDEPVNLFILN